MPTIGFGTAGLGDETGSAVSSALRAGYLLIDRAQVSTDLITGMCEYTSE